MNVAVWLRSLGLAKYEAIFHENDIDATVLPSLTHENLKELGVASFGHRVKLLDTSSYDDRVVNAVIPWQTGCDLVCRSRFGRRAFMRVTSDVQSA
jgi:SAM domain (Sterile alpha motif)